MALVDSSVAALGQGRTRERISWAPASLPREVLENAHIVG